ncbi:secreted RxLR effector protein 161-like [Pistacia vera]|uniref:secreted RxLR effector protein 161-like n=1 Tax=Pistacia vera TaxID=55513 RepID=UPI0012634F0C|nr:secreted RxLR effector protein 161-like [Pistacia vera]
MLDAKSVQTPLGAHLKLSHEQSPQTETDKLEMAGIPYASALGSLMYLMVCSRPDLGFAVSLVSRFMSNPGRTHWMALKWIMRYLQGTKSVGIVFKKNHSCDEYVEGLNDADYAGDLDKRTSTSGEMIERGEIEIEKIDGSHNPADMFTKSVPFEKHRLYMSLLQVQE